MSAKYTAETVLVAALLFTLQSYILHCRTYADKHIVLCTERLKFCFCSLNLD